MSSGMWLITVKVDQGVDERVFVRGTDDPKEAAHVAIDSLGLAPRIAWNFTAVKVHKAKTIRRPKETV